MDSAVQSMWCRKPAGMYSGEHLKQHSTMKLTFFVSICNIFQWQTGKYVVVFCFFFPVATLKHGFDHVHIH